MASSIMERYRSSAPPAERGLTGLEIVEANGRLQVREGRYYTVLARSIFGAVLVGIGLVLLFTFAVKFPPGIAVLLGVLDVLLMAGLTYGLFRATRPAVFFEVDGQSGALCVNTAALEERGLPRERLESFLLRKLDLPDGPEYLLYAVEQDRRLVPLIQPVPASRGVQVSVGRLAELLERPAYLVEAQSRWRELVEEDRRLREGAEFSGGTERLADSGPGPLHQGAGAGTVAAGDE